MDQPRRLRSHAQPAGSEVSIPPAAPPQASPPLPFIPSFLLSTIPQELFPSSMTTAMSTTVFPPVFQDLGQLLPPESSDAATTVPVPKRRKTRAAMEKATPSAKTRKADKATHYFLELVGQFQVSAMEDAEFTDLLRSLVNNDVESTSTALQQDSVPAHRDLAGPSTKSGSVPTLPMVEAIALLRFQANLRSLDSWLWEATPEWRDAALKRQSSSAPISPLDAHTPYQHRVQKNDPRLPSSEPMTCRPKLLRGGELSLTSVVWLGQLELANEWARWRRGETSTTEWAMATSKGRGTTDMSTRTKTENPTTGQSFTTALYENKPVLSDRDIILLAEDVQQGDVTLKYDTTGHGKGGLLVFGRRVLWGAGLRSILAQVYEQLHANRSRWVVLSNYDTAVLVYLETSKKMAISKPFFRDPRLSLLLHPSVQQPVPTATDAASATLMRPMSLMLPACTALLFKPLDTSPSLWLTQEITEAAAKAAAVDHAA